MSTKIVTLVKHSVITGSVYGTIEVEDSNLAEQIDKKTLLKQYNQSQLKNTNAAIRQRTQHK